MDVVESLNQLQVRCFFQLNLTIFGQWTRLQVWTQRSFNMTLVCGGFLALWCVQMLQAHLVYFLLQTPNQPFLQKALVYFCKKLHFKSTVWTQGRSFILS